MVLAPGAMVDDGREAAQQAAQRDGLGQHGIGFQGDGADSAFYLDQF